MRRFWHVFPVNAPIEPVAEFHRSTMALKQLTPPPMFVKFNQLNPMGEGSGSDFTIWLGPIPVHWVAIHSAVNPLQGSTVTQ